MLWKVGVRSVSTTIQTFSMSDPELIAWLESQENKSDTIKKALREYRLKKSLEKNTSKMVVELLGIVRGFDSKLDDILKKGE